MRVQQQLIQLNAFLNPLGYYLVYGKGKRVHVIHPYPNKLNASNNNPRYLSLEQVVCLYNMSYWMLKTETHLFKPRTNEFIELNFTEWGVQKALESKRQYPCQPITLQRCKGGLKLSDE